MRVEQGEAAALLEVVAHQALQQRQLAGAGLADEVEVPAAVGRGEDGGRAVGIGAKALLRPRAWVAVRAGAHRSLRGAGSWHCLCVERPSRERTAAVDHGASAIAKLENLLSN